VTALPADTVAYVVDYEEKRSRLSTFFRAFTALPHLFYIYFYSIPVFFVIVYAWFVVSITGKFPEKPYHYIERFERYYTFVYSYLYLATDHFPPFNGRPDTPYQARFLLGPPKAQYSRAKAFFRLILAIPFAIVAYAFNIIAQIGAVAAWFVIVFTGKQPKGLQDFLVLGLSYLIRVNPFYYLQTEDWPKFTDDEVAASLASPGAGALPPPPPPAPTGGFAPPSAAPESTTVVDTPPPPPAPPAPPAPEGNAPASDDEPPAPGGLTGGDPLR